MKGEGSDIKGALSVVGIVIVSIVVVAAIIIGGWQAGWWFKVQNTNRTTIMYQHSYGTQSAVEQESQNLITQIDQVDVQIADPSTPSSEVSALEAQKTSMVNEFCSEESRLLSPTSDVQSFASSNCH